VDDHGAGSECSVLIYYSHNSHSLSNYSVDVALEVVDHGHLRLGYELSNGSTVLTAVSLHSTCTTRAVRSCRYITVMVILYKVQRFSTADQPTSNY